MSNRWLEINCSLRVCRKVFAILKQKNPDLVPDSIDILAYRKNTTICNWNCGNWDAHFDSGVPIFGKAHIHIKQSLLFNRITIPTHCDYKDGVEIPDSNYFISPRQWIYGNFAIIEIICHELAHFTQLGHKKKFLKIYYKFLAQMAQVVISGEFYYWYSRQHQSKKHSGKADKQTAETKEWVDDYLSWTQHIPSLFGK